MFQYLINISYCRLWCLWRWLVKLFACTVVPWKKSFTSLIRINCKRKRRQSCFRISSYRITTTFATIATAPSRFFLTVSANFSTALAGTFPLLLKVSPNFPVFLISFPTANVLFHLLLTFTFLPKVGFPTVLVKSAWILTLPENGCLTRY